MRARMAACMLHARHDPRETTAAARRAFNQRFLDQVDPDRRLPERERQRRAEAARRAYFTRLGVPVGSSASSARPGPLKSTGPGRPIAQLARVRSEGRVT